MHGLGRIGLIGHCYNCHNGVVAANRIAKHLGSLGLPKGTAMQIIDYLLSQGLIEDDRN